MEELIDKRYAHAISSVSKDLTGALEVLNLLSEAISTPQIELALRSPIISSDDKTAMILSAMSQLNSNRVKLCLQAKARSFLVAISTY